MENHHWEHHDWGHVAMFLYSVQDMLAGWFEYLIQLIPRCSIPWILWRIIPYRWLGLSNGGYPQSSFMSRGDFPWNKPRPIEGSPHGNRHVGKRLMFVKVYSLPPKSRLTDVRWSERSPLGTAGSTQPPCAEECWALWTCVDGHGHG